MVCLIKIPNDMEQTSNIYPTTSKEVIDAFFGEPSETPEPSEAEICEWKQDVRTKIKRLKFYSYILWFVLFFTTDESKQRRLIGKVKTMADQIRNQKKNLVVIAGIREKMAA